jgi:hypothetical protein
MKSKERSRITYVWEVLLENQTWYRSRFHYCCWYYWKEAKIIEFVYYPHDHYLPFPYSCLGLGVELEFGSVLERISRKQDRKERLVVSLLLYLVWMLVLLSSVLFPFPSLLRFLVGWPRTESPMRSVLLMYCGKILCHAFEK